MNKLISISLLALLTVSMAKSETFPTLPNSSIRMEFIPDTGSVGSIRIDSAAHMNWVGFHGRWGEPLAKGLKLAVSGVELKPEGLRTTWSDGALAVEITRSHSHDFGQWTESYRFRNLTSQPLVFKPGDLAIRVMLADDYKSGAAVCLTARCHAHLWAEGSSAWISALQMNGKGPHLGLVLTRGALDGYSIVDRAGDSNDRGAFVVHPAIKDIPTGGTSEISWTIFSHQGWDDFFAKAKAVNPAFIRLTADRYTVELGQPIHVSAESASSLAGAEFTVNGRPVQARVDAGKLTCEIAPSVPGEQVVELKINGRHEKLVALVTPKPDDLLRARAEFLVGKKQVLDKNSPQDGAYPVLDLDTGKLVIGDGNPDHNTSRERMGSGVLVGLMWQRMPDGEFRERLKASFLRYYAFLNREIQSPDGVVHNDIHYGGGIRLYNAPWAAASHLCAWNITRDRECLQRLMQNLRAYYARDGANHYVICLPIQESLVALKEAGLENEYGEALGFFRRHTDAIVKKGINIPRHEVAYEQSIMAPAMQIIAETALVTGVPAYRDAAETFRPMLEAFGGQQPHYRLNDIGIRHWDGFWFGKPREGGRLFGDVMPHYWSTITSEAFRFYAAEAHHPEYYQRARQILLANFSIYDSSGAGHCAYLYPRSVNGNPAQYQDPWDNDQDWALVHYLRLERMLKPSF